MTEWSLPAHISGTRGTTTEPETGALLLAARDGIANGETWLWPIVLAAFLGTGNDETLGSAAADFFPIPSGPFAGTWVWEMRHRLLKDSRQGEGSGYRNRLVPLHSKLREWGFPEYVASRKGCAAGKLFGDESVDVASNNLSAWITETLKAAGFQAHRTFYCLRHRAHRKVPDNAVGRYVTGHAARDVHERYIKIDPVDLPEDYHRVIEAVEAVPDPTAEQSN